VIPIWGSGRTAVHHFQEGNWGRGTLHAALAVSDVFLVKSLVVAGGKLLVKGGAKLVASEAASTSEKAVVKGAEAVASNEASNVGERTVVKEAEAVASREADQGRLIEHVWCFPPGTQVLMADGSSKAMATSRRPGSIRCGLRRTAGCWPRTSLQARGSRRWRGTDSRS
jgi:hypothetical protein